MEARRLRLLDVPRVGYTKLCALVEGQGRLMGAVVAPGQTYEVEAAAPLLDTLKNVLLWAIKDLMPMPCAKSYGLKVVSRRSHRDRGVVLRLGITRDFTAAA